MHTISEQVSNLRYLERPKKVLYVILSYYFINFVVLLIFLISYMYNSYSKPTYVDSNQNDILAKGILYLLLFLKITFDFPILLLSLHYKPYGWRLLHFRILANVAECILAMIFPASYIVASFFNSILLLNPVNVINDKMNVTNILLLSFQILILCCIIFKLYGYEFRSLFTIEKYHIKGSIWMIIFYMVTLLFIALLFTGLSHSKIC